MVMAVVFGFGVGLGAGGLGSVLLKRHFKNEAQQP
jgi:hypothetical protein